MTQGDRDLTRSQNWTEPLAATLNRFRQRHVVDGFPLLFLGSNEDPLWTPERLLLTQAAGVAVVGEHPPRLWRAMVVSQGCDLVKSNFPWATVVPVYDAAEILNKSQQQAASAGQTVHFVHLTAPWVQQGFWVADLRLELPVEKTLLATFEPQEAFLDEVDYARLAERLGAQRARPAVPDPCLEHVVIPLFEHVKKRREEGTNPNAGVRELRVQCNDPISPTIVTLYVIGQDDQQPDSDEWTTIIGSLYEPAGEHGITLVGPEITSLWDMSARDYLTSAPIVERQSS